MAARRTRTADPVETAVEETAAPVEETTPKARKVEPKQCECGCGGMTRGGRYLPGHDARHHGQLLKAADAGDETAVAELVERGWATEESLGARRLDGPAARREASREARTGRKLAVLDAKIAALTAERAALLALVGEAAS